MNQTKRKFARFLMMAVSALGICSTTLLLTDPLSAESQNPPNIFNSDQKGREVASIAPQPETLFELNCNDTDQNLETASPRFRLKGQTCSEEAAAISTQVQNKSNGYVATVFHRAPQAFTTDYINLNEGPNTIAVTFSTPTGPVEHTLTIVRNTPPKSHN